MGEVFAARYELVDPIGRGGVGAVWRAWDHRRRRYVAAKVLQQSDAHTLLRFVREQALRIDHPHVLAPASWAADDDQVLFTMALVTGGSLAHLIGDYGPLPPGYVCALLDQLLSGLAAVHAEGVVHRDIKPANLLLEATGTGRPHLRVSDFGIAMRKGEPRLTETNYVVGTPGYFAPEQLLGAEPDFPADLFATGLVALYLLQGAKPDAAALVERFTTGGTPPAPSGIPEPLWQVVATLLQPDPDDRFRTANGARKALRDAAELLPEPGPDDELIEVFDQVGPLPGGYGPDGPVKAARAGQDTASTARGVPVEPAMSDTGSFHLPPPPGGSSPGPGGPPSYGARAAADPREATPGAPSAPPPGPPAPAVPPPPSGPPSGGQPLPIPSGGQYVPPPPVARPATPPAPVHAAPPGFPGGQPLPAPPLAAQQPYQAQPAEPPGTRPYTSPGGYGALGPAAVAPGAEYTSGQAVSAPERPLPAGSEPAAEPAGGRAAARAGAHRRAAAANRRPGPPRAVAVPVLLLAVLCFAVGFWALTRT